MAERQVRQRRRRPRPARPARLHRRQGQRSSSGTERPERQRAGQVVDDPIRTIQETLADATAASTPADVQFARNEDGGGTFTFTAQQGRRRRPQEAVEGGARDDRADGRRRSRSTARTSRSRATTLPDEPVRDGRRRARRSTRASTSNDVSISTVGPTWGDEVSRRRSRRSSIFFILLALYLSIRFEWKMAAAAIVAVIHDIIFTVGVYALFQFQVTPATVTAFLTILGFSLYDTVVVFDKVRENQRTLTATGPLDLRRDGEPVAEPGADAVAVDVARRAAAGAVAADRRLAASSARRRSRTSRSRSPPVCSSVRTRRSSSPRRCSRGGRSASRSTARSPNAGAARRVAAASAAPARPGRRRDRPTTSDRERRAAAEASPVRPRSAAPRSGAHRPHPRPRQQRGRKRK